MQDKTYQSINYTEVPLEKGVYENCTFNSCHFAGGDLSALQFEDCRFEHCDLSNVKTDKTAFRTVFFEGCKMMGMRFDTCNAFLLGVAFKQCVLDYASFYNLKLPRTKFRHCRMVEVDFALADIQNALFEACDLSGALFENTLMEGADLSTAVRYTIDPDDNHLSGAVFAKDGLAGLLQKYRINIVD